MPRSWGITCPRSPSILLDIFLQSVFDPEEVERERMVVLQEISMVEDTPDEYAHVLLGKRSTRETPWAGISWGPRKRSRPLPRTSSKHYLQRAYGPEKVVVAAAGQVDHEDLRGVAGPGAFETPACPETA